MCALETKSVRLILSDTGVSSQAMLHVFAWSDDASTHLQCHYHSCTVLIMQSLNLYAGIIIECDWCRKSPPTSTMVPDYTTVMTSKFQTSVCD